MGYGTLLKLSQNKHGINNFNKVILKEFYTYEEVLLYEKSLVTPSFIELDTNYNLREGGWVDCLV